MRRITAHAGGLLAKDVRLFTSIVEAAVADGEGRRSPVRETALSALEAMGR
ncbi:hypothetical protein ACIF8T_35860 [Streptomyces sp. NPDC085946]|uniref:hypothetical protein n=1 Tax=Streptomyces sp. NPDC085946 TaxID=3365744 RepID=UPI0037D2B558